MKQTKKKTSVEDLKTEISEIRSLVNAAFGAKLSSPQYKEEGTLLSLHTFEDSMGSAFKEKSDNYNNDALGLYSRFDEIVKLIERGDDIIATRSIKWTIKRLRAQLKTIAAISPYILANVDKELTFREIQNYARDVSGMHVTGKAIHAACIAVGMKAVRFDETLRRCTKVYPTGVFTKIPRTYKFKR